MSAERPEGPAAPAGPSSMPPGPDRGPLAWMATNPVPANLLMLVIFVGGLVVLSNTKREVFPEFELDLITISVAYPGASPEEVEQGVVLAIEEAVRGIDGVKEVNATANEGMAAVRIELLLGTDKDRALSDVKAAVDRITSFPEDVERPVVAMVTNRYRVLQLVLYGDVGEKPLRGLAERARDELLQDQRITTVELSGVRPLEISIEVSQENLRRYGLTLDGIARTIRNASVDLPGGTVKTDKGEILLRMKEQRDLGHEFEDLVILSNSDGTEVLLRDIATIKDGFAEVDRETFYNGKRAALVDVYRTGEQGPTDVSDAVHEYIADSEADLPAGVQYAVWQDQSEVYGQRVDLLLRNGYLGLGLVLLILGLFLEIRLAFWVTLGIPISFAGAMLFLPSFDVSINMISLFAFIVVLGMVVDDAIVVGEAVYKHRRDGESLGQAAISGVREVAAPVTFSIMTTVIAFMPLLFVPGMAGKFFRNLPLVVIAVLAISLVESLLILPAHLSEKKHILTTVVGAPFRFLDALFRRVTHRSMIHGVTSRQQRFSNAFERLIQTVYRPFLEWAARFRYVTLAVCVGMLILTVGLIQGGRVLFTFMPKIEGDVVTARLEMPVGTPVELTREHEKKLLAAAQRILDAHGGERIARGILSDIGGQGLRRGPGDIFGTGAGNIAQVHVFLVPPAERELTVTRFASEWRQRVGDIPGAEALGFQFSTGHSGGMPVHVRLNHPDLDVLEEAGAKLARAIADYSGTYDISDGFARGKEQLDFKLRSEARSLGLTQFEVARQVRSAFFGAEALRQQRGREEIRVYVRRPLEERRSEHDIEGLIIRTPGGGEIPLSQAAEVTRGRAYTSIGRVNGRRTADITADVDETTANAGQIMRNLLGQVVPRLMDEYPGLRYELAGQRQEQAEMMASLGQNFVLAVIAMYGLLAVAFRSYFQPLIVLLVIPFGMIGAVLGHILMGYTLSLMTMMGVVALSGVVVNSSLLLVVAVNRFRESGLDTHDAVLAGAQRRFRPIVLTSLTTFFGLSPMITETSMQARFMIPMAISLGFGVLFATLLTLVMLPCAYLALEDAGRLRQRLAGRSSTEPAASRA